MIISRYGPITFRHFQDNPYWAAAAGYDFNYFDCLSVSIDGLFGSASCAIDELKYLPETEVRELHGFLIKFSLHALVAALLVFLYPLLAIAIHIRCTNGRKKYSEEHEDTVKMNMKRWIYQCDRKWGKNHG